MGCYSHKTVVYFKKLNPKAVIPSHSYGQEEAGLDFHAFIEGGDPYIVIQPRSWEVIPTGVAMEMPSINDVVETSVGEDNFRLKKHYMKLYSRSGLSAKHGIEAGAGVIDASYRGEVKVVLFNHSNDTYSVYNGDKIAQGILYELPCYEIAEVEELEDSTRGTKGFGSSGK